jgi:hypothetical protein
MCKSSDLLAYVLARRRFRDCRGQCQAGAAGSDRSAHLMTLSLHRLYGEESSRKLQEIEWVQVPCGNIQ